METKVFDLEVPSIEVQFGEYKFIIDPDLPIATIKKLNAIQKDIGDDFEKSSDFITASIREYLIYKNDEKSVDEFISKIGSVKSLKVYKAIANLIASEQTKEITDQKKTE